MGTADCCIRSERYDIIGSKKGGKGPSIAASQPESREVQLHRRRRRRRRPSELSVPYSNHAERSLGLRTAPLITFACVCVFHAYFFGFSSFLPWRITDMIMILGKFV